MLYFYWEKTGGMGESKVLNLLYNEGSKLNGRTRQEKTVDGD